MTNEEKEIRILKFEMIAVLFYAIGSFFWLVFSLFILKIDEYPSKAEEYVVGSFMPIFLTISIYIFIIIMDRKK